MKKITKLVAFISMSLLACGAFAQIENNKINAFPTHHLIPPSSVSKNKWISNPSQNHRSQGATFNGLLDYVNWDQNITVNINGGTYAAWGVQAVNTHYITTDSTHRKGSYNYNLIHSVTVA